MDLRANFYCARRKLRWRMPLAGLQDTSIIGRKLGWPLSEAYLLDG
jgi:hypothetical protein